MEKMNKSVQIFLVFLWSVGQRYARFLNMYLLR